MEHNPSKIMREKLIQDTLGLLRETRAKIGQENPALMNLLQRVSAKAEEEPLNRKNRITVMKYLANKKRDNKSIH